MSKKIKGVVLGFATVLVLGGLSSFYFNKPKSNEVYNIGDTVQLNNHNLVVNSVKTSMGNEKDRPQQGNEFVILNVTLENNSNKEMNYNPYNFQITNSEGDVKDRTFTAIDGKEALNNGVLAPGEKVTGTIVVQEPIGDKDLKLHYTPNIFKNTGVTVDL
ncbi:DUF4352 domain-containing protein [Clostridium sp. B9]|uniref:DUF4352 domain-containing protein n=1 Tax=Clostridium sp. B9 TaxID=3423224 RepID=UPI003D2F4F72